MNYRVSIIVPIYNGAKYLPDFFSDLTHADLNGVEVLFVVDGSPDNSLELCLNYMDSRSESPSLPMVSTDDYECQEKGDIRVINLKRNMGCSTARKLALGMSKGEYISFLDSDDRFSPKMFQDLYETAITKKADCVWENYYSGLPGKPRLVLQNFPEDAYEHINIMFDGRTQSGCWNKLFRRQFCQDRNITFFEGRFELCEDFLFMVRFMLENPKMAYHNDAHYHHVFYKGTMSHSFGVKHCESLKEVMRIVKSMDFPAQCLESRRITYERSKALIAFSTADDDFFNDFLPEVDSFSHGKWGFFRRVLLTMCLKGLRKEAIAIDRFYSKIRCALGRLKKIVTGK